MSTSVTPYAAYTGTLPDFKDLYTFGYKAMPRKLETQFLKSFEPRTKEDTWVLIGMQGNHIWKILNVNTLREVKLVDCGFNEYIFPEFDSEEFCETQDMSQQVSMQKVLSRKGLQASNKEAIQNQVLQDLDYKSTSGVLSRLMRGAREDNIVVEIPKYYLIRDKLDFFIREESYQPRVESLE